MEGTKRGGVLILQLIAPPMPSPFYLNPFGIPHFVRRAFRAVPADLLRPGVAPKEMQNYDKRLKVLHKQQQFGPAGTEAS
ncbi:hypothetical protein KFK09_025076 [Dendrobium nobile]|uniref:Uncharacterized protein n=1 Tax=Dendrobium nobile TaxID=94219 RepID=A0A8T3AFJ2_DENNO|nr:hypothetical protein KFK09_025076 [Dendrobium nobile]